jgi:hypothetical protein
MIINSIKIKIPIKKIILMELFIILSFLANNKIKILSLVSKDFNNPIRIVKEENNILLEEDGVIKKVKDLGDAFNKDNNNLNKRANNREVKINSWD